MIRISTPEGKPLLKGYGIVNYDRKSGNLVVVDHEGFVYAIKEPYESIVNRYEVIRIDAEPWKSNIQKITGE